MMVQHNDKNEKSLHKVNFLLQGPLVDQQGRNEEEILALACFNKTTTHLPQCLFSIGGWHKKKSLNIHHTKHSSLSNYEAVDCLKMRLKECIQCLPLRALLGTVKFHFSLKQTGWWIGDQKIYNHWVSVPDSKHKKTWCVCVHKANTWPRTPDCNLFDWILEP